jgi:hypothetical protein
MNDSWRAYTFSTLSPKFVAFETIMPVIQREAVLRADAMTICRLLT